MGFKPQKKLSGPCPMPGLCTAISACMLQAGGVLSPSPPLTGICPPAMCPPRYPTWRFYHLLHRRGEVKQKQRRLQVLDFGFSQAQGLQDNRSQTQGAMMAMISLAQSRGPTHTTRTRAGTQEQTLTVGFPRCSEAEDTENGGNPHPHTQDVTRIPKSSGVKRQPGSQSQCPKGCHSS